MLSLPGTIIGSANTKGHKSCPVLEELTTYYRGGNSSQRDNFITIHIQTSTSSQRRVLKKSSCEEV